MVSGDSVHFGLSLLAGSLSTLSPCVFPLMPVVVAGVVHAHHHTGPLAMGAGMVLSFVLTGVLIAAVGPSLGIDMIHLRTLGGILLVLVGLVLTIPEFTTATSGWFTGLATLAQRLSDRLHPETLHGAFYLGALLGMIWSPCSGPLLGSAVALVATKGDIVNGALMFGVFGIGAALPLMFVSYASRSLFIRARDYVMHFSTPLRRIFAVAIILLGVSVITGFDRYIERLALEALPAWWVRMTVQY